MTTKTQTHKHNIQDPTFIYQAHTHNFSAAKQNYQKKQNKKAPKASKINGSY